MNELLILHVQMQATGSDRHKAGKLSLRKANNYGYNPAIIIAVHPNDLN